MHKIIIVSLLCQCGLFIDTCVSKSSVVSKDVVFFLFWYNLIRWSSHICKKISFLSFYSFLVKFIEWHSVSDGVKWTKCDKDEWCKKYDYSIAYFLNNPMFNLLFYCHIILYWEKLTSDEKLNHKFIIIWKISAF